MAVTYDYYTYTSDTAGLSYVIKMKKVDGDAITGNTGGATPAPAISHKKLRHIDGVDNSTNPPTRRRIVCCSPASAMWTSATPGTFSISGQVFKIVGRIGEKRF